jgi:hypothetical protein
MSADAKLTSLADVLANSDTFKDKTVVVDGAR